MSPKMPTSIPGIARPLPPNASVTQSRATLIACGMIPTTIAPYKPLIDIPLMAQKATEMLTDSIDALLSRDTEKAQEVRDADDEVDDLYDKVYRDLLEYMINDPTTIQRATYLLWVAHDLERIADRATNIAEQVQFLVDGKNLDIAMSPIRQTQRERLLAAR